MKYLKINKCSQEMRSDLVLAINVHISDANFHHTECSVDKILLEPNKHV